MDLASRGPNSIPTVDSGHSPAYIRLPWERKVPSTKRQGRRMIIMWTQSNKMKANILYLSEDSGRWTVLIWAQTQFRDSVLQTGRYWVIWINSVCSEQQRQREEEWTRGDGEKKEREESQRAREHSTRDVVKFRLCQINFSVIWEFN